TRMMRYMDENYSPQVKIMELNESHSIIERLKTLYEKDPDSSLLNQTIFQLLENQELLEGNLKDPTEMVNRITEFIENMLEE
ncbi:MAG: hypothetical protein ACW99F_16160, partial [Candidatus Hodarchaeales archaeon]